MRAALLSSTICLALATFSMAPAQNAVPAQLENVHRVVMLGDSITQGGENPGGYVWLTRRYLQILYPQQHIEVINAGISGNKCTDMTNRFQSDVLDKKPDLLTVSVGVNDVWHGFYNNHPNGDGPNRIPLEEYRAKVSAMVEKAQAQGIRVVMLSATPIYEDFDNKENAKAMDYNAALRDIARRHHCTFVDYQRPFRDLIRAYRRDTGGTDNFLTVDGVHMNPSGNKVMAHFLLTAMGVTAVAQNSARAEVAKEAAGR